MTHWLVFAARSARNQSAIGPLVARLTVTGIDYDPSFALDAKPQTSLGMIELCSLDGRIVERPAPFGLHDGEGLRRRQGGRADREIGCEHLTMQCRLYVAIFFGTPAEKFEPIVGVIERCEEGQTLDVIPVVMRQEATGMVRSSVSPPRWLATERSDPGSRIEDDPVPRRGLDLDAGGIASVLPRARVGDWNGSANAVESNEH